MKYAKITITLIVSLMLADCAPVGSWLPGQLYSNNGTMMTFAIQTAFHSGGMRAYNPQTKESFTGTYVGILPGARTTGFEVASSGSGLSSASGFGLVQSNIANATGFLRGSNETMMTCQMEIQAGLNPHGIGVCTDNHNNEYQLQF